MTARCVTLMLLGVTACGSATAVDRVFDGSAAMAYLETQLAFGPRVPNTDGHRQAGDWLRTRLLEVSDTVIEQRFTHLTSDGDTLRLRNFLARFRPDAARRIMYVAHWDTRPFADASPDSADRMRPVPGANDGASGVALLLGVADALAVYPPADGVDLLFVDGEDYGDFGDPKHRDVLIGSRYYAMHRDRSIDPEFAVVWDMVADAHLRFLREGYSLSGAPSVVDRVWGTARALGHDSVFVDETMQPIVDDHLTLQEAGVRAIVVIDLEFGPDNAYHHTMRDDRPAVRQASLQLVGDVALAVIQ